MTAKTATLSLDSLNLRKAHADAFDMEYRLPDGSPSGVVLMVLGGHSEAVQAATAKLLNERRKREAVQARSKPGAAEFTPVELDVEFSQRSAAARIAGWKGITEDYTPELALKLCEINPELATQVMEASADAANFTKPSSPKS